MGLPFADSLCHSCAAPPKYVRTETSTFIRCPLMAEKYPRQPVRACELHRVAVIETERLLLRELTAADAPFLAAMPESVADPRVALELNLARYARDGFSWWLAIERASGVPVGLIGLLRQVVDGQDEPEVSYHVHAAQRRKGFAAEGARAVQAWAYRRYDHVIALIRDDNLASQAVARKLGMTPGGTAMHVGHPHRIWRADRP